MGRITLSHLTITGTNVAPASVDFSPHVTVIHGPSDTGKSFIVDAIDFALGAKELKDIPERKGYSRVLLGLILPTGKPVTLARSVNGGSISLYRADIRIEPSMPPDDTLAAKHNSENTKNVSRFLLDQVGLDRKQVRKNIRNETHTLSFRNLTHLCLVGETAMQSEEAPGLSGNVMNKTKEVSVLKMLLSGDDDSALTVVSSAQEQKRLRGARQEVVERMLSQLESQLQDAAEEAALKKQLGKLNRTIDQHSTMIGTLTEQRGQLLQDHNELQSIHSAQRSEHSDAGALRQRFTLLRMQYESDLARLEMIAEAGNLLGYFQSGTCVFCGAEPTNQHLNLDCEGNTTSFGIAVESESQKTRGLLDDLRVTLESLDSRTEVLRASISAICQDILDTQTNIKELDAKVNPEKGNLRELLATRSEIEKHLGLYEQVETLESMIRQISDETEAEVATAVAGLSLSAVREFSIEISKRLTEWDYPSAASVRYDRNELDIIAGNQRRAAHGKGVRAVLHAAFTLALAQYCFDRDLPHPGFVVLDSPLVTYRPPDQPIEPEPDDKPPEDLVRAFYRDIQDNFDGQVIVMENSDPLDPLGPDALDIRFTKRVDTGRYGFIPTPGHAVAAELVDAKTEDCRPEGAPRETRRLSVEALNSRLSQENTGLSVRGLNNRGSNALYIVDPDGAERRIYLSASRNYWEDEHLFSSWNTISLDDISSDLFSAFVLSAEDENNVPLFFIFTPKEMRDAAEKKTASRRFVHFYISNADTQGKRFKDARPEADGESLDFTVHFEAWHSLTI